MLVDAEFVLLTTLVHSIVSTMIFFAVKKGHHFDEIVQIMMHVKMVKGKTVGRLKSNRFHKRWGKVSGEGDSSATRRSKLVGAYRLQLNKSPPASLPPFPSPPSSRPTALLSPSSTTSQKPAPHKYQGTSEREREREREREVNPIQSSWNRFFFVEQESDFHCCLRGFCRHS